MRLEIPLLVRLLHPKLLAGRLASGVQRPEACPVQVDLAAHGQAPALGDGLQHHRRILRKADYQRAYNPDIRYDEYVRIDEFFVKKGEAGPEKIQLTRKTIESLLPEMKAQIAAWSKSNGSKLKSEEELVSLLQHLESLN